MGRRFRLGTLFVLRLDEAIHHQYRAVCTLLSIYVCSEPYLVRNGCVLINEPLLGIIDSNAGKSPVISCRIYKEYVIHSLKAFVCVDLIQSFIFHLLSTFLYKNSENI